MLARLVLPRRLNPIDYLPAQVFRRLLHPLGRHLHRRELSEHERPMSEIVNHGFHRRIALQIEAGGRRWAAMATRAIRGHEGTDSLAESPRQVGIGLDFGGVGCVRPWNRA